MYKKSLFIENNIEYREGVFFEDVDFSIKSVFFAKSIKYFPLYFYIHTFNKNSIVNSKRTTKKIKDQIGLAIFLKKFLDEIRFVDETVYSILIKHVILVFIEPLRTSIVLSFKDRLDTCVTIKNNITIKEINFKENNNFFIFLLLINISPLLSAALLSCLLPFSKLLCIIKNIIYKFKNNKIYQVK